MFLNFDKQLFHWVNIFWHVERSNGYQKCCVVQAYQFSKHLTSQVGLKINKCAFQFQYHRDKSLCQGYSPTCVSSKFTCTLVNKNNTRSVANEANLAAWKSINFTSTGIVSPVSGCVAYRNRIFDNQRSPEIKML